MPARHEHSLRPHHDLIAAYSACRRFEISLCGADLAWLYLVGLAVLLLNFDDREPVDGLDACLVFAPLQLSFTFRDAPDHLENVIAW